MKTLNSYKSLNISLWSAQVLLALIFLITGVAKLFLPIEKLFELLPWTQNVSSIPVRLIGFSEIIGSIGLILPSLLRKKPHLTPWAAVGIAVVMLLATIFNVSLGETKVIGINAILFLIAAFIAWGRFKKSPNSSKYRVYEHSAYQK